MSGRQGRDDLGLHRENGGLLLRPELRYMDLALLARETPRLMPYRPQFETEATPDGYTDEEFVYVFNDANTPALGVLLSPGQTSLNIPLQLQADAPEHIIRSIQIGNPQSNLGVRFRDPFDNYISESGSDDFVSSYAFGSSAGDNGQVLEPEISCPRGSVFLIDIANIG